MKKLLVFIFAASVFGCDPKDQVIETESSTKYDVNLVDETVKGDVEVRNGVLHFRDLKGYDNVSSRIFKGEKINFEGFESYFVIRKKLISEMESDEFRQKTKPEFKNWLEKNSAYVQYENESIRFVNDDPSETKLINKNYIFYIGKMLFKLTNDRETIVLDGDLGKLVSRSPQSLIGAVLIRRYW